MAQDCPSELRYLTIDTIDELGVQHPKISLAIEILTIDGVGNLRGQDLGGYRPHPGHRKSELKVLLG